MLYDSKAVPDARKVFSIRGGALYGNVQGNCLGHQHFTRQVFLRPGRLHFSPSRGRSLMALDFTIVFILLEDNLKLNGAVHELMQIY